MSRESLLDDAITKAKEAEDWQLVEWLRMARGGESAARWYTAKLREREDENAKLRELVSELWVSCPVQDSDCDKCQHKGGRWGCELYDRMKELGVDI